MLHRDDVGHQGAGAEVIERREAAEGLSDLSAQWTDKYLGGQDAFTALMRSDVDTTLEAIRAAAEA